MFDKASLKLGLDKAVLQSMSGRDGNITGVCPFITLQICLRQVLVTEGNKNLYLYKSLTTLFGFSIVFSYNKLKYYDMIG